MTISEMPLLKPVSNDYRKLTDKLSNKKGLTAKQMTNLCNRELEIPVFFNELAPFCKMPMGFMFSDDMETLIWYMPDEIIRFFNDNGVNDLDEISLWYNDLLKRITLWKQTLKDPMVNLTIELKTLPLERLLNRTVSMV